MFWSPVGLLVQLGWGYGSGWMEGGTAPGSSRASTGAIPNSKVARAGVQSWQQGLFEVQGASRDPLPPCWGSSHLVWWGLGPVPPLPSCSALMGQSRSLGQAMLELKSPEPDEEQLVLKGWCFCSIPRGGWKGCVEHSASFCQFLLLSTKTQLFKKESFLKICLICCAVPEPGCLTLGFPGFVCRDLKIWDGNSNAQTQGKNHLNCLSAVLAGQVSSS